MLERKISQKLFEEAKTLFPGGVNSPVRAFKSVEGPPLFIKKGNGSRIYDEDDHEFLDFCCSWGPLILGHNNQNVRKAIEIALQNGTSFGTPNRLGNELGKLILNNHRYIEKLRFVSSGTEAVMSAVRLARGFTGKNKILKFEGCYHGHVDSLLVKAGSGLATFGVSTSAGIPSSFTKETLVLPLNDLAGVEKVLKEQSDDLAAIIIEPIPANNGLLIQDRNFLVWLRTLCDEHDVLLIFDEVISGFRIGFEGAAGFYSIQPDIITFGKIIGGGMPVGAYGGSNEIMSMIAPDGPVYQAGTLSANPIAMAAGFATLKECLMEDFYEDLQSKTDYFVSKIETHAKKNDYPFHIQHIGSIFWIAFNQSRVISAEQIEASSMNYFKKLHGILLENGIYLGPSGYEVGFISHAHSKRDLDIASEKINLAMDSIFS